jgi:hypothetical protein
VSPDGDYIRRKPPGDRLTRADAQLVRILTPAGVEAMPERTKKQRRRKAKAVAALAERLAGVGGALVAAAVRK